MAKREIRYGHKHVKASGQVCILTKLATSSAKLFIYKGLLHMKAKDL